MPPTYIRAPYLSMRHVSSFGKEILPELLLLERVGACVKAGSQFPNWYILLPKKDVYPYALQTRMH